MADQSETTTGLYVQIEGGPRPSITRERVRMEDGSRIHRGFVVVTGGGSIAWASFRPNKADAEQAYKRWNPMIDMHPTSWRAEEVEIILRPDPV